MGTLTAPPYRARLSADDLLNHEWVQQHAAKFEQINARSFNQQPSSVLMQVIKQVNSCSTGSYLSMVNQYCNATSSQLLVATAGFEPSPTLLRPEEGRSEPRWWQRRR